MDLKLPFLIFKCNKLLYSLNILYILSIICSISAYDKSAFQDWQKIFSSEIKIKYPSALQVIKHSVTKRFSTKVTLCEKIRPFCRECKAYANRYYIDCYDRRVFEHIEVEQQASQDRLILFHKAIFRGENMSLVKNDLKNVNFDINFSIEYIEFFHKLNVNITDGFLEFRDMNKFDDSVFESIHKNLYYNITDRVIKDPQTKLNIRFVNCKFDRSAKRKPFRNLYANVINLNEINMDFIDNSLFDYSIINDINIMHSPNFIGFSDNSDYLPNGKLRNAFYASNSYKTNYLCQHSLPSFVDQATFHTISIYKCLKLNTIKDFTFKRYLHLKKLLLSLNNFTQIDRYAFKGLHELELLDLSNNPIVYIHELTFSDLVSLKTLKLKGTDIRYVHDQAFTGLHSLENLYLYNSKNLTFIEKDSFEDSQDSLKLLDIQDTGIKVISNDSNLDFVANLKLETFRVDFADDMNLIHSLFDMNDMSNNLTCELMSKYRYNRANVISLSEFDFNCSCFVYWLYQFKNFSSDYWTYRAPWCYRKQITLKNGIRDFRKIVEQEELCNFEAFEEKCFSPEVEYLTTTIIIPTTTIVTTTPATTTTTTTTTMSTTTTKKLIVSTTSLHGTSSLASEMKKRRSIDLRKLLQVVLTVALISVVAIVITFVALKVIDNKKKEKIKQQALASMKRRSTIGSGLKNSRGRSRSSTTSEQDVVDERPKSKSVEKQKINTSCKPGEMNISSHGNKYSFSMKNTSDILNRSLLNEDSYEREVGSGSTIHSIQNYGNYG